MEEAKRSRISRYYWWLLPVVLLLLVFICRSFWDKSQVPVLFGWIFFVLTAVWGGWESFRIFRSSHYSEEEKDKPVAFCVHKWWGATFPSWYAGFVTLFLFVVTAHLEGGGGLAWIFIPVIVVRVLLIQFLACFLGRLLCDFTKSVLRWLVPGAILVSLYPITGTLINDFVSPVDMTFFLFYGFSVSVPVFILLSQILFLAVVCFGMLRLLGVCVTGKVGSLPWGLIFLVVVLMVWGAGVLEILDIVPVLYNELRVIQTYLIAVVLFQLFLLPLMAVPHSLKILPGPLGILLMIAVIPLIVLLPQSLLNDTFVQIPWFALLSSYLLVLRDGFFAVALQNHVNPKWSRWSMFLFLIVFNGLIPFILDFVKAPQFVGGIFAPYALSTDANYVTFALAVAQLAFVGWLSISGFVKIKKAI